MAERALDRIDVRPTYTDEDAASYDARFASVPAPDMLRTLLVGELHGQIAVVSSFGTESAVLLHMVAQADPATPVVFTDTLKMFPETLAYRDTLVERLGLLDVRVIRPAPALLAAKDPDGIRHGYDPDGCCDLRKVEPLARGLAPFEAWISGRKGFQAGTRRALPRFEVEDGRLKLNPLADWDKAALDDYFAAHNLPRHPLEAEGYLSIGCAPCTSKVKPGEDPRSGRWRGFDKVECGIHRPVEAVRPS
ncbi:phosphoadenylyl-sulfate reductase [Sphingomonas sanguinis]|uniref:Adenosine 5'-phosphosulfate reductase n=1 Tax=Sphingomonas sanguinis TaxID=33051 RepID=A0ABU5LQ13_9SPHN|nr:phosphoadenylyl-sulfate reductase [Sphingomonas sanguinis]MDZ7282029.1 phosphoadenylyl-sulfate reductase [Sphingomonas sanguinis]QXT35323.1 phosphoadenylyl-sulfate reductase [Sphingomonas sanguinis]